MVAALGLFNAARRAGQFGFHVKAQRLLGGQLQGFVHATTRFFVIAALKSQASKLGLNIGVLFRQRLEGVNGLLCLAVRFLAGGQAECGLRIGGRLRFVDFGRFFVPPVH